MRAVSVVHVYEYAAATMLGDSFDYLLVESLYIERVSANIWVDLMVFNFFKKYS